MPIDVDKLLWLNHDALFRRDRSKGRPSQTLLRRSISNFYYALFHKFCRHVADAHVGPVHRGTPRYDAVYRAFDHGRTRATLRRLVAGATASERATEVAQAFLVFQSARNDADYNPSAVYLLADALGLLEDAEAAIACLRGGFPEKADMLTALLVTARG